MEKFTATADPYTGVHPFFPNKPRATGVVALIKRFLVSPIIFLLRLPFLIVFGALLLGGDFVVTKLPVPALQRALRRAVHLIFGGLLLFTLGLRTSVSYYPMRNRDAGKKRPDSNISSKSLIISNHSSYLDILYFAYAFSPQFTSISSTGLLLAPVSLYQALVESITSESVRKPSMPLSKLCKLSEKSNSGPVLVFPEGTTTNGKIIIGSQSVVDIVPDAGTVNLVSVRYPFEYHTPTFTGGSFMSHFFQLAGQMFNYMEVVHAMPDVIPTGTNQDARGYLDDCMAVLSASSKLAQGKCMRDTKAQFWLKFYEK